MNSISTPVGFTGDRIERHFESARRPRLLPRAGAFLKHSDDAIGNFLSMVAFYSRTSAHPRPPMSLMNLGCDWLRCEARRSKRSDLEFRLRSPSRQEVRHRVGLIQRVSFDFR